MRQERLLRVATRLALGAGIAYAIVFLAILALGIDAPGAFGAVVLVLGLAANTAGLVVTIVGEFTADARRWRWTRPFLANVAPPAMTSWLLLHWLMLFR